MPRPTNQANSIPSPYRSLCGMALVALTAWQAATAATAATAEESSPTRVYHNRR